MDDIRDIVNEAIRQADESKRAFDEWQATQEAMQPVPEMVTRSSAGMDLIYKTRDDALIRTPSPRAEASDRPALEPYEVICDEMARFAREVERSLNQKVSAAITDLERRYGEIEKKLLQHRVAELEQQLKAKSVLLR